ncbi:MAG: ATP-binding protein [Desulfocapsaceae bacterium]
MKKFFNQIPVKICASILLIETTLLSLMGIYYVTSFNREIDQRVQEKLALPGILMSQRALNYDSVRNYQIIEELVQETILETLITKNNGEIFYAADKLMIGKPIEQFWAPEEHLQINNKGDVNKQVDFKANDGNHCRSSLSQIRFDDRVLGYLYIKIDATKIVQEKRTIILLFLLGSLLAIFLTTLIEAFYIHRLFVPRIRDISTVLKKAEKEDLSARVSLLGSEDELHGLIHLVNRMLDTISKTINSLISTQEALKASEERFRELSDLLPEGVFELDLHGSFTYVNLQLCKEFQYSRGELYNKIHFTDLLTEEDFRKSSENFKNRLEGRRNIFSEYEARRKDGTVLPVMVNAAPIGQQGQARGIRGIVINLTERNRIQKQLWQTQKMDSIGRLSASVAHEFGNPLVGINWLLMDIQNIPDLDESKKELITVGLNECRKMQNLITNFQAFVQPSSDEKSEYDINRIIDDILLLYNKYIADRNVDIQFNSQKNLPHIPIVKDQIHQVLVNILMNALDSLNGNKNKITITTRYEDNQVLAAIEDSGRGITAEDLEHIFEPFFSTKPDVEGTGLGLYISYMIIKKHNGTILAESEIGTGSVFTIGLPVNNLNH